MKKNDLLKRGSRIFRVLEIQENKIFVIDCVNRTMPQWRDMDFLVGYSQITEQNLQSDTNICFPEVDSLNLQNKKFMYEHYTLIAGVLPFVSDDNQRNNVISKIALDRGVTKKTIRKYLCLYLTYQNIAVLVPLSLLLPNEKNVSKELSQDEKNFRWALNRFYYNKNKNSLNTAYTLMLKEKYCNDCGVLLSEYPTFNQFRYFYRKTRKLQTYYISRDGLKHYQRNDRPLLGEGVQEFASNVGICMLDSTVCDIYLVNDSGELVGRPLLVAAVDGYSGLCCGYSLLWEGGVYSLRGLMLNIIDDKQKHCIKWGIQIDKKQWDCSGYLPAIFVCDKGSEYESENFSQITELGCTIINLPSYRPELKSSVERFFQSVQDLFKPYLKGKGVIEPDYQERGSHDYRKDACLTLQQFEKIIVRCIVFYNSKRIIEDYPYTEDMIQAQVKPYASEIWEWGKLQAGANLISVSKEQLVLTLLPRTTGRFSRFGLIVNNMRYKNKSYTEKYLSGGNATVSYNPEDASVVWLIDQGSYVPFMLIESRYKEKSLSEIETLKSEQKTIVNATVGENIQAKIDLANYIGTIVATAAGSGNTSIKGIRNNRQKEQARTHVDYMEKVGVTDE